MTKEPIASRKLIAWPRIHDELTIDAAKMPNNRTIRDFRNLLDEAYKPRIRAIEQEEAQANTNRKSPTRAPSSKLDDSGIRELLPSDIVVADEQCARPRVSEQGHRAIRDGSSVSHHL
ncbi:hypothetical protein J5N97_001594 [Dioscorea zingiberensis]|uniref:Uncharacterized protein n=1 Tax=Dioscorea zingiberensis TaxID=325984 RepID=A0A9D5H229_9LILI|nr:hypothetical protein J5N97_001594 [Dioscorea zingiberensis]